MSCSPAAWRAPRAPIAALALVPLLLSAAPAVADGELYLGASGGYTLDSYRRADLNSALVGNFASGGSKLDLRDTALRDEHTPWSLTVGYRFAGYFALEASYIQLGTLSYAGSGTASSLFGGGKTDIDLEIKSRGPALALVGTLPLTNNWNVDARLGAYEGKTTTDYAAEVAGIRSNGSQSQTSASLLASVGASYIFSAHWLVRLDYTHLNSLGEKLLGQSFNVDLLTAGVLYAF